MITSGVVVQNVYEAIFWVAFAGGVVGFVLAVNSPEKSRREAVGCAVAVVAVLGAVGVVVLAYLFAHLRWLS